MTRAPKDELAEISRLVAAHLEWQRELGASEIALDPGIVSALASARPRSVTANRAAPSSAPAKEPVRFVRAEIMQRIRTPEAKSPEPQPVAPRVEPAQPAVIEPVAPPPRADLDSDGSLRVLQDEVAACKRCRLHEGRTQTVFARGDTHASIAFVGEGPGRDEDQQGYPFVGAAGQLLDKIIAAMGLARDAVYVCNVVKCRPPNNRVPAPDEMAACGGYLVRQLALVKPKVIVALGKTAVSYLIQSTEPMGKLRGRWHEWEGVPLLPTWHPAYLLRTPSAKRDTWDDMKLVLERLGLPVPKRTGGA